MRRGFTLIELIIAGTIAAMIAGTLAASFSNLGNARESARRRLDACLLYTSPSPRDMRRSRMPSSA